jgi:hypothetical protein
MSARFALVRGRELVPVAEITANGRRCHPFMSSPTWCSKEGVS